ncbi:HelD family protein [Rarobacter incanus]|uniref:DNA helicase IV n=1 Tax=Rarobacter incanus TaxID=153494 RepID=A0A542SLG7_9MICO|nr:AAA family ATPase [Rarobacter incanus]TQK75481.1 DNA helicase IV [Rarobacter incanus]
MTKTHEIATEQAVVSRFYDRLDELRALFRARLAAVRKSGPSGSPQNRSERDAFAALYEDRANQLDAIEDRLCFGRLDADDGATTYIGRIGLTDAEHRPILTDWRAPAAAPFYRATAAHRLGIWRRRHLTVERRKVVALEDDLLDVDRPAGVELAGEGALMAALSQGRTGKMHDIVATIQSEQDRIIRSEVPGALVVQGGPGTGKTAVALHRAAYLLYSHRDRLSKSGVLIVGPSRTFLRYIDQVLPSLGETGVVSTTIAGLVPGMAITAVDTPQAARVKGSTAWLRIIENAVRARERVPAADEVISIDGVQVVIRRDDIAGAIAKARRRHKPHNEARLTFVKEMLRVLTDQYLVADGQSPDSEFRGVVSEDLRTNRNVRRALNIAWFPITAEDLIADLFAKPHRLEQAAPMLSPAERDAVRRERGAGWSVDDVPLVDHAWQLLGPIDDGSRDRDAEREREQAVAFARDVLDGSGAGGGIVDAETLASRFSAGRVGGSTADRATHDRDWVYGHIVVDEAQELSAMAWRSLIRRCPTRSFTIVGDTAQTSSAAGTRNWEHRLARPFGHNVHIETLTVNYRTPAAISDLAVRVARAAGLRVSTLTPARDVPDAIRIEPTGPGASLTAALRLGVAEAAKLADGTVVVITSQAPSARQWLAQYAKTNAGLHDLTRISVASAQDVKGLEYDVVVIDEPAAILSGPGGAADLFVALTRATRRLVVSHSADLPAGFALPHPGR